MPAPSFTGHFVLEDDAEDFAPEAVGEPRVLDDGQLEALTPEHGVVVGVDGPAHALDDHQVRLPFPHQHGQALVQAAATQRGQSGCSLATSQPHHGHSSATTRPPLRPHFSQTIATLWPQLGYTKATTRTHCSHSSATPQPHCGHTSVTPSPQFSHTLVTPWPHPQSHHGHTSVTPAAQSCPNCQLGFSIELLVPTNSGT